MSTGLSKRGNKPRPLQASTNIIHNKISKTTLPSDNIDNLKLSLNQGNPSNQNNPIPPLKKKTSHNKLKQSDSDPQQPTIKKVDENDVSHSFAENPYNPLDDIYPFDEELYKKVLKLELADDGLPKFESDEPFDF